MADKTYARRYAQAVFQIARENNELDRWRDDLEKLAVLGEDPEFVANFEHPRIPFDEKRRILAEQFGDVNPLALNLIYLLLSRDSLEIITEVAEEYGKLLDAERGIEQALVTTAVPLEEEDMKKLEEQLGALVGKTVMIKAEVDPEIIGGITARVGGKLIDGSTRNRLDILKREIGGKGK